MTKPYRVAVLISGVVGLVAALLTVASPASAETETRRLLAATGVGCLSAKDDGSRPRAYAPDCNDGPNQQWRETTLYCGWAPVILANVRYNQCLSYASVESGIILKPCDTTDDKQRWDRIFIGDDTDGSSGIIYRNQFSERCLRAPMSTNGWTVSSADCDPNQTEDRRIRWLYRR